MFGPALYGQFDPAIRGHRNVGDSSLQITQTSDLIEYMSELIPGPSDEYRQVLRIGPDRRYGCLLHPVLKCIFDRNVTVASRTDQNIEDSHELGDGVRIPSLHSLS